MKKVVLASLTQKDIDRIVIVKANIATLKTLLTNQFIECENERTEILNKISNMYEKEIEILSSIKEKYKIPFPIDDSIEISYDNNEIYLRIWDEK
ncbi:MAG: hypothetical protein HFE30_07955 [Clostridiales bacterium]|nr:hypothetical protein [Clostridiales bacterium]